MSEDQVKGSSSVTEEVATPATTNTVEETSEASQLVDESIEPSSKESQSVDDGSYYKQELERLKKEQEALVENNTKLQKAVAKASIENRHLSKQVKTAELSEDISDEQPLEDGDEAKKAADFVDARISKLLNEQLGAFETKILAREIGKEIESKTPNPDHQKLIRWYYDNRIKHTGDLSVDIDDAAVLANRQVIQQATQKRVDNARLRSAKVESTTALAGGSSVSGGRKPLLNELPRTNADEKLLYGLLGKDRAKKVIETKLVKP